MFVCNLKLSRKLIFKIFFVLIFIVVIVVAGISAYKIFNYQTVNDNLKTSEISNVSSDIFIFFN